MRYSEAKIGRVFILRLEDGDVLNDTVTAFAAEHGITAASLIVLGGADSGSKLVVGPKEGRSHPIVPLDKTLDATHEIAGVGTIFPNAEGRLVAHIHLAAGRTDNVAVGCARLGVKAWHVMEVVIQEFVGSTAHRALEPANGFELLQP